MTLYIGLYKQKPPYWSEAGEHLVSQAQEISGGGYARQEIKMDYLPQGEGPVVANSEPVLFPIATRDIGYVDLARIFQDDERVLDIPLMVPARISIGTAVSFAVGSIIVSVDWTSQESQMIKQAMETEPLSWNDLSEFAAARFYGSQTVWERAVSDEL